ncbi:WD40 repeat-containing protein, putative, partial [Bodo saltans]
GGGGGAGGGGGGGGNGVRRRPRQDAEDYAPRKKVQGQRPVDTYAASIRHIQSRLRHKNTPFEFHVPPHAYYSHDLLPAFATPQCPATALCTQWVNTSYHPDTRSQRARISFFALKWAPTGRRLLASTGRGEFLLINGHNFGLEVKTVAHDEGRACRALAWGRSNDLILSGDDNGTVKMWLPTFVVVSEFQTNHKAVREISTPPTEMKFVTAGQDGSARIWDTEACASATSSSSSPSASTVEEETKLEGHGGDVCTVDWHPFQALIATGSQDRDIRLWDPRTAASGSIATLQGHAQALTSLRWHHHGNYLLSGGRDCMARIWDLRMAKEVSSYHGHSKDVLKVHWHPTHHNLFVTAGLEGSVLYWLMNAHEGTLRNDGAYDVVKYLAQMEEAHEKFRDTPNAINDIAFSPTGHVLATCSADVRTWHRNKPGALEEQQRGHDMDNIAAM